MIKAATAALAFLLFVIAWETTGPHPCPRTISTFAACRR